MMEAARQNGIKKFVYASSSSVYGDEPNLPKTEGREGNLLSPYALTKRCTEEWGKQYTRHYGLETVGLLLCVSVAAKTRTAHTPPLFQSSSSSS